MDRVCARSTRNWARSPLEANQTDFVIVENYDLDREKDDRRRSESTEVSG